MAQRCNNPLDGVLSYTGLVASYNAKNSPQARYDQIIGNISPLQDVARVIAAELSWSGGNEASNISKEKLLPKVEAIQKYLQQSGQQSDGVAAYQKEVAAAAKNHPFDLEKAAAILAPIVSDAVDRVEPLVNSGQCVLRSQGKRR